MTEMLRLPAVLTEAQPSISSSTLKKTNDGRQLTKEHVEPVLHLPDLQVRRSFRVAQPRSSNDGSLQGNGIDSNFTDLRSENVGSED